MAGTDGSAYNSADALAKTPGTSVDAGVRRFRNVFNLADAGVGGTTNPLIMAIVPTGSVPMGARATCSVSLAGINLQVGIAGNVAKYATAQAGAAADTIKRFDIKATALAADPLTGAETVILTPSAAWPAAGTLVTDFEISKR
ncbi:hypothetical protein [Novosphingobium huizhouense]|uniref:hypothetical protein n=1 Tax=Novosphingobium huizhouense TaxID=2866625 RepID=UPI001CD87134|nr:hypothetical protein [Novosphingobium huizhouense]